jgi:hypothetical protein
MNLTPTERRVAAILADHLARQYPGTVWRATKREPEKPQVKGST